MLILACGSRHYTDRDAIRRALLQFWPSCDGQGYEVIHGAARGADTLFAEEASRMGARVRAFPADWSLGRRAGPLRTMRMFEEQPHLVLAAGEGRGTQIAVDEAERRGVPVVRIP
jgi:hypothetical protein